MSKLHYLYPHMDPETVWLQVSHDHCLYCEKILKATVMTLRDFCFILLSNCLHKVKRHKQRKICIANFCILCTCQQSAKYIKLSLQKFSISFDEFSSKHLATSLHLAHHLPSGNFFVPVLYNVNTKLRYEVDFRTKSGIYTNPSAIKPEGINIVTALMGEYDILTVTLTRTSKSTDLIQLSWSTYNGSLYETKFIYK